MGHVRDLPRKTLGVDVKKGFAAEYEVLATRKKVLDELKAAAKEADTVYLAADPDREGEAICWHLAEELKTKGRKQKVRRVVFNEITKRAIEDAFKNPGEVDEKKVDAQQARRILDRLVGYKVSPILWDKVRRGLSAGRVQSVALQLICDREREIRPSCPRSTGRCCAHLEAQQPPLFPATSPRRTARTSRSSTPSRRRGARRPRAGGLRVRRSSPRSAAATPCRPSSPPSCSRRPSRSCASGARRRCRWRSACTRAIELGADGSVGLITYMRTDSTRISDDALVAVRERIAQPTAPSTCPKKPNVYKSKKGAQDAHEAIRPSYVERETRDDPARTLEVE
jgi:DNA topoisomerase-1